MCWPLAQPVDEGAGVQDCVPAGSIQFDGFCWHFQYIIQWGEETLGGWQDEGSVSKLAYCGFEYFPGDCRAS